MMKLENQIILITGGTSGIGLAFAKALAEKNKVIIVGRNLAKVQDFLAENSSVTALQADLTSSSDLVRLAAQVPDKLTLLINCAGIMRPLNFFDGTGKAERFTDELATNLAAPVILTKLLLPKLVKSGQETAIVNISSGLSYVASGAHPVYSATKAGINAFSDAVRAQAEYFGASGLHVIQIAPPLISETNLEPSMRGENNTSNPLNMRLADFIRVSLAGIERNKNVINPGASKFLRLLGHFAPLAVKNRIFQATLGVAFGGK
ncbi:SDR family oxidoreductase [Lactovum odontotermitis]